MRGDGAGRSDRAQRDERLAPGGGSPLPRRNVLAPVVYVDCGSVVCAEDAPVAVGFAAYYYYFDFVSLEHVDQLIRVCAQHAGVGFFAVRCARIDVVLDQLIVPVLAGWHAGVVVDPVDQFVFGLEAASVDKQTSSYGVQDERGMLTWVHAAQHVAHVVLPVRFAQTQRERRMPTAAEHRDGAVGSLEAMRHVQRLPGTALFVFGEGDAVVRIIVALRTEVRQPRFGAALKVLGQQRVRAANRSVGMVVWTKRAGATVHLQLVPHWTIHHAHRGRRRRAAAAPRDTSGSDGENHWEILRARASHDGIHRHFFDGVLPEFAEKCRPHSTDHFVRFAAGVSQHLRDALFRWQDDRELVRPVVLEEQAMELFL